MNKSVLTEINRINELLGTKKNIILESTPLVDISRRIARDIRDIFTSESVRKRVIQQGVNLAEDILEIDLPNGRTMSMLRKNADEIGEFINQTKSFPSLTRESKQKLLELFRNSFDDFNLYNDWMNEMLALRKIVSEVDFLKSLDNYMGQSIGRPPRNPNLREALRHVVGDDVLADEMFDQVELQKRWYDAGRMKEMSNGRLQYDASIEARQFEELNPFTPDEVTEIMNTGWFTRQWDWIRNKVDFENLQRLIKNLEDRRLTQEQRDFINRKIYDDVETIFYWKKQQYKQLDEMIKELENNPKFSDITTKYNKLQEKYGVYGARKVLIEELAPWRKTLNEIFEAWKSTGTLKRAGAESLIKFFRLFKKQAKEELVNEAQETFQKIEKPGLLKKLGRYITVGDERGFPTRTIEGKFQPYEMLIKQGGMPAAVRSYAYKLIIQMVRNSLIIATAKVFFKGISYFTSDRESTGCLAPLRKVLFDNKVYTSSEIEEFVKDEKNFDKLPKCFIDLGVISKARLLAAADYTLARDTPLKEEVTYAKIAEIAKAEFGIATFNPILIDDIYRMIKYFVELQSLAAVEDIEKAGEESATQNLKDNLPQAPYDNNEKGFKTWLASKQREAEYKDFKDGIGYTQDKQYKLSSNKTSFEEIQVTPQPPVSPTADVNKDFFMGTGLTDKEYEEILKGFNIISIDEINKKAVIQPKEGIFKDRKLNIFLNKKENEWWWEAFDSNPEQKIVITITEN